MESLEPELIREIFSQEEEYNEDLRRRLITSPVFEQAKSVREHLIEIEVSKEGIPPLLKSMRDIVIGLDASALEQGVMYEEVTVKGEGISVPSFDMDFADEVALLSLMPEERRQQRSYEKFLNPNEYKGKFSGFTVYFKKVDDDVYVPTLAYQVSMETIDTPHAYIALFATGDVNSTQLYFDKDEKLERVLQPLNTLFTLCEDKAASVNEINITLAGRESHDAMIMRQVGFHADLLVNSVEESKRTQVEDAVGDLVSTYIGKTSAYQFVARQLCVAPPDKDSPPIYYGEKGTMYPLLNICSDIVFLNRSIINNGKVIHLNKRTAHLVVQNGEGKVFVPMGELVTFEKQ